MKVKAMILWVLFVSSPTIILVCYLVYKLRQILIAEYGTTGYWVILFFAMWAAMILSSKRVLKELFSQGENERGE